MEAILASGHMGVIVQLAESCAESGEKQEELMQCLLNVTTKEFVVTAHMGLKSIEHYPCFCVFLLLYD